jgi:hypothetical protein
MGKDDLELTMETVFSCYLLTGSLISTLLIVFLVFRFETRDANNKSHMTALKMFVVFTAIVSILFEAIICVVSKGKIVGISGGAVIISSEREFYQLAFAVGIAPGVASLFSFLLSWWFNIVAIQKANK